MSNADNAIVQTAAKTYDVITRAQLRDLKLTTRQIDGRVQSGLLRPMFAGVYLVGAQEPTFTQRAYAAAMASGGHVSHTCAAALFGFRRIEEGDIEVTVPRARSARLPGVTVHRCDLSGAAKCMFGKIPMTSPAKTLIDLTGRVETKILAGALDHCLVKRLTNLAIVNQLLRQTKGRARAGLSELQVLVDKRLAGQRPTESPLEDDLFEVIEQAELPEPERQLELPLTGGKRARFDGGYGELQLGLEADGDEHHAELSDRERDVERDRECRAQGWEVLRFTTGQIRDTPADVAEQIRAAYETRLAPRKRSASSRRRSIHSSAVMP